QARPPAAARGVRRVSGLWWGLAVAASAAALRWLTPWRGLLSPTAPPPATGRDTVPAAQLPRVPPDTTEVAPHPAPAAAHPPAQPCRAAGPATRSPACCGPAGGDQGGDCRLRARARIARPERSAPRLSRIDICRTGDLSTVLPVGPGAQGGVDHQSAGRRGRLSRRYCERCVRVRGREDGPNQA